MRIATALALAATLGWSTTSAAEPFGAALEAEAAKVARAQAAADRDSGWPRVEQLRAGQDIVVRLHDGTAVRGKFVHADASSMRVNSPGSSRLVPRREIYTVQMARGRGSPVGAAIGAAGGALVGLAFVSRIDFHECSCAGGPSGAVMIPIGAAIGLGVVGYHAVRHEPETIYFAP